MQMPNVITEAHDPDANFTFKVRAYRKLTQQEMKMSFAIFNQQRDKRRTLKNKTVEVTSIIGMND
jgi:hypothetical protein